MITNFRRKSVDILTTLHFPIEIVSGVPKGIRTPVTAVKGRCPRPLDDGDT